MQDQMVSHAIKVLGAKEQAGFWSLYFTYEDLCRPFCLAHGYDVDVDVSPMSSKLKLVRDKTHFHLDRLGVLDPNAIWEEADFTWGQFERALTVCYSLLDFLHQHLHGHSFHLPEYDGLDAKQAAQFVEDLRRS